MTQFEKIKEMTIGEMAKFIVKTHDYAGIMDQACAFCIHRANDESLCKSSHPEFDCIKAMRILLQQEVKQDGTCKDENPVE